MNEHYAAVLSDLRTRRTSLLAQLQDVDATINGIIRLVGENHVHVTNPLVSPQVSQVPSNAQAHDPAPESRFAHISVRWAVLWHLAEFTKGPEKTGEIASAIRAGGYKTNAAQFGNMVSAVLSNMKTKGEVQTTEDGGYQLTPDGERTWQLIRQGAKFRFATSSNENELLALQ